MGLKLPCAALDPDLDSQVHSILFTTAPRHRLTVLPALNHGLGTWTNSGSDFRKTLLSTLLEEGNLRISREVIQGVSSELHHVNYTLMWDCPWGIPRSSVHTHPFPHASLSGTVPPSTAQTLLVLNRRGIEVKTKSYNTLGIVAETWRDGRGS